MNEARLAAWQAKVQVTDFCWQWTASLTKGYGQFRVLRPDGTISRYAHQASFEHFFGPVPDGYEIDHVVCGVKTCVYPGHMEAVPVKGRLNTVRYHATFTHCQRGHELEPYEGQKRICRVCKSEVHREWVTANRDKRRATSARRRLALTTVRRDHRTEFRRLYDEAEGGRHRKRDQAERALAKMYPAEYRKVYDGG